MKINKQLLLIIVLSTCNIFVFGQSNNQTSNILDFYIPAKYNKHIYFYIKDGNEVDAKQTIYYVKNNSAKDYNYEELVENSISGRTVSIALNKLNIKRSEICLVRTILASVLKNSKEEIVLIPEQIILKLPELGKVEKWRYKSIAGDEIECVAERVNIEINGTTRNAIKLLKAPIINGEFTKRFATYEYYVEGIGLWNTTFYNGKKFTILKYQRNE